jgi:hypothetical protein
MDPNPYQSPSIPAERIELGMSPGRGPFYTPRRMVVPLLYAGAMLSVLQAGTMLYQYFLLVRMGGDGAWTQEEAELNDLVVRGISVLYLVLFVATIVAWWRWQLRAAHNIRAFGERRYQFTPGWTIGYFFVPFANLFKPYQAVKEIDIASNPAVDVDAPGFGTFGASALIGWWWAFWLIGNIAGHISFRMPSETIADLKAGTAFALIENGLHLAVCLVAAKMIGRINDNQYTKAARLQAAAPQTQHAQNSPVGSNFAS